MRSRFLQFAPGRDRILQFWRLHRAADGVKVFKSLGLQAPPQRHPSRAGEATGKPSPIERSAV